MNYRTERPFVAIRIKPIKRKDPLSTTKQMKDKTLSMKRILIAGANSYIGDSFQAYLKLFPGVYDSKNLDTIDLTPAPEHFQGYDVVFCVAGIAHIKETADNRDLYYKVNRDLVIEMAKCAKAAGVKQFILLSTMAVYGKTSGHITKQTSPNPMTADAKSKYLADEAIFELEDKDFYFSCLRLPMVYGRSCKGNYQTLRKVALRFPIFPNYRNRRSMIYIGNLCEFVRNVIDEQKNGLFFPQNAEYVRTSEMVSLVAELNGRHIRLLRIFNWGISLCRILKIKIINKVFGDLTYERENTVDRFSFRESIELTEKNITESDNKASIADT